MIRPARIEDLPALTEIYNYEILHGNATFDTSPFTLSQRQEWFSAHTDSRILLVRQQEETIVGYASFSTFNPKPAYHGCVELSLYIHHRHRGQGHGKALISAIMDFFHSREDLHTIVSLITQGNKASIGLHRQMGFIHTGTLRAAGIKEDKLLDVEIYQYMKGRNK